MSDYKRTKFRLPEPGRLIANQPAAADEIVQTFQWLMLYVAELARRINRSSEFERIRADLLGEFVAVWPNFSVPAGSFQDYVCPEYIQGMHRINDDAPDPAYLNFESTTDSIEIRGFARALSKMISFYMIAIRRGNDPQQFPKYLALLGVAAVCDTLFNIDSERSVKLMLDR